MKRYNVFLVVVAVFLAGVIGVMFSPVIDERTIRDGTDEFGAHHALWGKREKSVTGVATSPIRDIGLILVNMRRAATLAPVELHVATQERGSVANAMLELPLLRDDEFTWFSFRSVIIQPGEHYTITVAAPLAHKESPVGVRFDTGDTQLALSFHEQIPVWEKLTRWVEGHRKRFFAAVYMLGGGVIAAAILLFLEYIATKNRARGITIALVLLASFTLYIRIPLSAAVESAYGGDAFNYILKGHAWIAGEDPFAADPRKAPLYAFLTAPGLLPGLDPILWARGISILAAMATVVLVSLFLVHAGAPLAIAVAGGLLLSVNRDYQFESVQGLSNTLFAALVMACAYAFVVRKKYLVSVFAALATLTRYEGVAAAGVLLPAMWVTLPSRLWNIVREAVPFLILVAIPFVLTPLTGNSGVRTISDVTGDEGLYIAYSWEYFLPSIQAFKVFFGRLWVLVPGVGNPFAALGWGAAAGLLGVWFFQKYGRPRSMLAVFPALICVALLLGTLWGDGGEVKFFIALFSALVGFGAAAAARYSPRTYLPIILVVLSQALIITAILPKNRYYLHILPFIAITMAGSLWIIGGGKRSSWVARMFSTLALCMIASFAYGNAGEALSGQISDYNEKSVEQTIEVQAGRYLKKAAGKAAVYEGIDLPIRAYVGQERIVYFPETLQDPVLQYKKIKDSGCVFLLNTSNKPYFTELLQKMPEQFQEVAVFKTRWADISSRIYRVY